MVAQINKVYGIVIVASRSGASCSKLMVSLVNDSLKFQMTILQIHVYTLLFFVKKCENPLQCILSTKININFVEKM